MKKVVKFGLSRKIVANMTTEGWSAPHACIIYEYDVTKLLEVIKDINRERSIKNRITLNTVMLKIIAEGMRICPEMNGHIKYNRILAGGKVTLYDNVDITIPFFLSRSETLAVTIKNVESKSLSQLQDEINDIFRRLKNTNVNQAMYEVALSDTLRELRHFHIIKALGRFIGFALEGGYARLLRGKEKRKYNKIPASDRLTVDDLKQGTITVSNLGTLKGTTGICTILELIPPQISAYAISSVEDKPVVDRDGNIKAAKVLTVTGVIDHRALDAGAGLPLVRYARRLFNHPEVLKEYL